MPKVEEEQQSVEAEINPETPEINENEVERKKEEEIKEIRERIANLDFKSKKEEAETGPAEKPKEGFLKKTGRRFGETIGRRMFDSFRDKAEKLKVECSGSEHLDKLEGQPYILAANHIKPKNSVAQSFGLAPDAFLLERVVAEKTKRKLNIIANVTSKLTKIPFIGKYVEKYFSPVRETTMEAMGFIPVRKKPGSPNKNFIRLIEEAIERNEPMMPEEKTRKDITGEIKKGISELQEKSKKKK
jgi:hypothetical protein